MNTTESPHVEDVPIPHRGDTGCVCDPCWEKWLVVWKESLKE